MCSYVTLVAKVGVLSIYLNCNEGLYTKLTELESYVTILLTIHLITHPTNVKERLILTEELEFRKIWMNRFLRSLLYSHHFWLMFKTMKHSPIHIQTFGWCLCLFKIFKFPTFFPLILVMYFHVFGDFNIVVQWYISLFIRFKQSLLLK